MGKKKDKNSKKGKGAEKTALKTEKKADKKTKKHLAEKGEDDVESLIAEFSARDKKLAAVVEERVLPPSPRVNLSMTPHPDRDELILFGGEYFNGSKTFMYNDLLMYNIRNKEWTKVQAPNPPPPRCAHQAVSLHQGGGQLWIFGGEFASPSQSQFYHYKDLWVFHIKEKRWEQVKVAGGPSARSGHRMVVFKRQIVVFGGFHDNVRDYKYYNDVYAFNLDTWVWCKLEIGGNAPSPRSACQMTQTPSGLLIYGGYSKERVKKDVDQGKTHTDMYLLAPDSKCKDEPVPSQWKWQTIKQHGVRPSQRCGFTLVATPGNRALFFGGVFDEEEDEESVKGRFYNDMYSLELEKGMWHEILLKGKKDANDKKRRRKRKEGKGECEDGNDDAEPEDDMEDDLEELCVDEETKKEVEESSDSIFKVTIGPQTSTTMDGIFSCTVGPSQNTPGESGDASTGSYSTGFVPCPRMNALLAVKGGCLYLFGGMVEVGDRQITLADMYSLDLHKLDEWQIIIQNDVKSMEWHESDSSDSSDDEDEGSPKRLRREDKEKEQDSDEDDDEDDDDDDDDDDDSDSDMDMEIPTINSGEEVTDYFSRNKDYWLLVADDEATKEGVELSGKNLKKKALKMAENYFTSQKR